MRATLAGLDGHGPTRQLRPTREAGMRLGYTE
jgi:hypothetical protein